MVGYLSSEQKQCSDWKHLAEMDNIITKVETVHLRVISVNDMVFTIFFHSIFKTKFLD